MSNIDFEKIIRSLTNKESKPLILFARMSGAGLFFLASIFITNSFSIKTVSDFEFVNSLLLLLGSIALLGSDISILQISGKLKSENRFKEIRAIFMKYTQIIFFVSSLAFLLFFVADAFLIDVLYDSSLNSTLVYKVLATIGFYAIFIFTAEAIRPIKGNLITELYHGVFKYQLFFIGALCIYFLNRDEYLIDLYLLNFIVIAIIIVIHFVLVSKKFTDKTTYDIKTILKNSAPMAVSSLSFFILLTADVIILKILGMDEEVSIYAQPLKLVAIIIRIKVTLEASYSTNISSLYFSNKIESLRYNVKSVNRWIALFCIPIIVLLVIFAKEILSVFGTQYEAGTSSFYILLLAVLVNVVSGCIGTYMNMTGKQVALQYILLCAATINVILNIILIPPYGMQGAAMASLTSVVFWNGMSIIYVWKKDDLLLILR